MLFRSVIVPILNAGYPKTRFVLFTCADPDFNTGVSGPFHVSKTAPDHTKGEWIGVPQAFLSPEGDYLLYYIPGCGYSGSGMFVARVSDIGSVLQAEAPGDVVNSILSRSFVAMGPHRVQCNNPGSTLAPTMVDEQFVFQSDGK